ncbi:MAG: DUF5305 family protein [Halarchaeum sp.]
MLRLTYLLAKRGPRIALALALVALAAFGAAGWTATHPPTTDVTDHENEQRVTLAVGANATVTGNTSLYERGTVLHDPAVFPPEAPVVTVTPRVRSANASFTSVSQHVTLVYTATRRGEPFWTRTIPLATDRASDASTLATPVTVDTARVRERLRTYRNDVGDAGTVAVAVRTNASYRVAGYAGRITRSTPLALSGDWYDVETASESQDHSTTRTRTVAVPSTRPVPPAVLGGLGALAALAAVCALAWYRAYQPSLDVVAADLHRHRYAEWISTGVVPATSDDPVVDVATLEDLVDVAIDADSRVIYDPAAGRYVALTPAARYRFTPDETPTRG